MDDFSSPSYRRTSSSTRRTTPDGKRKAAAHAVERERDSIGKINSDGKSSVNGNDGSSAKQRRRGQSPPRGAHKDKKARSQLMGKQSSKSSSKKRRRALAKQYSSSDIGVARQKTETSSGGKNRRKGGHTRGVVSSDASCKPSSLVDDGQSTMKKPPPPTTTVSSGTTSAIASLFLSEHVSGPHRIGTNRTQKVTTHPGERDVLLGRGRSHREHLGNQFFHHLVAMQRDQYDQLNREDKTELTRHIVRHIREEGGRFLKKDKVIQRSNHWCCFYGCHCCPCCCCCICWSEYTTAPSDCPATRGRRLVTNNSITIETTSCGRHGDHICGRVGIVIARKPNDSWLIVTNESATVDESTSKRGFSTTDSLFYSNDDTERRSIYGRAE